MFVAPLPSRRRKQQQQSENASGLSSASEPESNSTVPPLALIMPLEPETLDHEHYSMSKTPRCTAFRQTASMPPYQERSPRSRASSFVSSVYSSDQNESFDTPLQAPMYDAGLTTLHATGDEGGFLVELKEASGSKLWPVSFGELCRLLITRE